MGNNILYINEKNKSELTAPYVYICGARTIDGKLQVIAMSDRKLLELTVNGNVCCRQKNDSGEFDFVVALPTGRAVIKAASASDPELLDEISIEL